jgi:hypothetical protein
VLSKITNVDHLKAFSRHKLWNNVDRLFARIRWFYKPVRVGLVKRKRNGNCKNKLAVARTMETGDTWQLSTCELLNSFSTRILWRAREFMGNPRSVKLSASRREVDVYIYVCTTCMHACILGKYSWKVILSQHVGWSGLKWLEVAWSGLKWLEVVWSGLNNKMDEILETENKSETDPYPSDLDGVGCNQNGKTCPVAPAMVPRPETAKWMSFIDVR